MTKSKFVIVDHDAFRAGKHQDFRFKMPNSNMWASFAVPKGVPKNSGEKVLAIRTPDHTEKDAYFTGNIPKGEYGGGVLTINDRGICNIISFNDSHIAIDLSGSKYKGVYHFVRIVDSKNEQKQYFLFKAKEKS